MKTSLLLFALGLGWAATTIPASLAAQDETPEDTTSAAENFELSLFPGVQLRGEDSAIRILRLGLYNKNVSVKGLDIGIVNQTTGGLSKGLHVGVAGVAEGDFAGWQSNFVSTVGGRFKGLQLGVVGIVEGDFEGWQNNAVSIVKGEFNGLQGSALYNRINYGEAVQIGFFNRARDISGFQLGLVNWAENMHGIQIGLINIISGKESLQFLPIVNWSF